MPLNEVVIKMSRTRMDYPERTKKKSLLVAIFCQLKYISVCKYTHVYKREKAEEGREGRVGAQGF